MLIQVVTSYKLLIDSSCYKVLLLQSQYIFFTDVLSKIMLTFY